MILTVIAAIAAQKSKIDLTPTTIRARIAAVAKIRAQVQNTVKKVEDTLNDITDEVSKNFESFLCMLLGILSLTCGTFICGIVSLVFAKKAAEKGQDEDAQCATFCKVGKICSKLSIAFTIIAAIIFVICWIIVPLTYGGVSNI